MCLIYGRMLVHMQLQVSRELMYSVTLKKYSEIRIHITKSYHLQFYTQMKYNLADQLSTGKCNSEWQMALFWDISILKFISQSL